MFEIRNAEKPGISSGLFGSEKEVSDIGFNRYPSPRKLIYYGIVIKKV